MRRFDAPPATLTRRSLIACMGMAAIVLPSRTMAQAGVDASDFGLAPDPVTDQSAALQAGIDAAAARGLPLLIAAGTYVAQGIVLPANCAIVGVPGASVLQAMSDATLASANGATNISIEGIGFAGASGGTNASALISFQSCGNLNLRRLDLNGGSGNGIWLEDCQGMVADCRIRNLGQSGIHAQNSAGLTLTGNTIQACANGGIRVWRHESGRDGTIVTGNRISGIGSQSGNGQNGNGVNIFRADEVIVANNAITDCDFSAIRANSTVNTIIRGNMCTECREVAIFSEFAFSGSIVSGNIVDDAALGISITNFDHGGRLAVVSDNIVRNIRSRSPTNPDTSPVGIYAEADTAITGNTVDGVPGIGVLAGWGPYLRDVLVNSNVVRDCRIGIAASVAKGAGQVRIADNMISGARQSAISGMRWKDAAGSDLARQPNQFANIAAEGNAVN